VTEPDLSRGARILLGTTVLTAGTVILAAGILMGSLFNVCIQPALSRFLFSATGLLFILFGISFLLRRKFVGYLGRVLGGVAVTFLVFETVSVMANNIRKELSHGVQEEKETEVRLHSGIYRPFTVWRASPFHSERLNVDNNGLRIVPGAVAGEDSYTIFVFGGHLQRLLAEKLQSPVNVVNFAQQGYVNTQEIIELQLQLRTGNIPDLVIFYDGANEIWSAVEADTVGVHINLAEIRALYENRNLRDQEPGLSGILSFFSRSNSVVLLRNVMGMEPDVSNITTYEQEPSRCVTEGEAFVPSPLYADTIMSYYEGDLRILDALSREFGFEYSCFWQPVLVTGGKTLTDQEAAMAESQSSFIVSLYGYCEERSLYLDSMYENFHSITSAFDTCDHQIYVDICHVNAAGDSIIAALICSEVEEIVKDQL